MNTYSIKSDLMKEWYGKDGEPIPSSVVVVNAIQLTFGDRSGDWVIKDELENVYICEKSQFEATYNEGDL